MVRPVLLVIAFVLSLSAQAAQQQSSDSPQTVALVLGGGGAHALAHIGILEELERQQAQLAASRGDAPLHGLDVSSFLGLVVLVGLRDAGRDDVAAGLLGGFVATGIARCSAGSSPAQTS